MKRKRTRVYKFSPKNRSPAFKKDFYAELMRLWQKYDPIKIALGRMK